jgi:hypothetical protein
VAALENAIFQWQRGERRLGQTPLEQMGLLEPIADRIVAELRRRLGGRFYAAELADLYGCGTAWCLALVMDCAPDQPWAWDSGVVVDAAFGRYLREAADFAGGRLTPSD